VAREVRRCPFFWIGREKRGRDGIPQGEGSQREGREENQTVGKGKRKEGMISGEGRKVETSVQEANTSSTEEDGERQRSLELRRKKDHRRTGTSTLLKFIRDSQLAGERCQNLDVRTRRGKEQILVDLVFIKGKEWKAPSRREDC